MSRAVANDIADIGPANHGTRSRPPCGLCRNQLISERPIGDALWGNLTATYRTQFSDGFQNSRRTRPATALTGDYHGSGTPIALRVAPDASWISRTGILYQSMPAQIIHRRRLLTAADGR